MLTQPAAAEPAWQRRLRFGLETLLLVLLFFAYAGDQPPMVNEAHYLVKAKNFWQPDWCAADLFASSGKAHAVFYWVFGWPTLFFSLETTAWLGRFAGWLTIAVGLARLCKETLRVPFASLGVTVVWVAGIEYANLAGEWVIGGIEAKVPAYGFLLIGLSYLVTRRWSHVWPWLGLASAFHVLVGGWGVIAAAFAWWVTERRRQDAAPLFTRWLFVGGAIALLGLIPSLRLSLSADGEEATLAARIYTYMRISHHLLPAAFHPTWWLRHGILLALCAIAVWLNRKGTSRRLRRLEWFTAGTVAILIGGLLVGMLPAVAPNLAAKLLRYYWFRLSDAVVPLCFGVLVMRLALDGRKAAALRGLAIAGLVACGAAIGWSSYERSRLGVPPSVSHRLLGWDRTASPEVQQRVFADWLSVCTWIEVATPADAVFLTPRHQQTFKWYAGRAEVVNWKDVPQDAASLLEWRRRMREVFPRRLGSVRTTIRFSALRTFRDTYGAQWMVVDRRVVGRNLPLVRVYPESDEDNRTYAVYALP